MCWVCMCMHLNIPVGTKFQGTYIVVKIPMNLRLHKICTEWKWLDIPHTSNLCRQLRSVITSPKWQLSLLLVIVRQQRISIPQKVGVHRTHYAHYQTPGSDDVETHSRHFSLCFFFPKDNRTSPRAILNLTLFPSHKYMSHILSTQDHGSDLRQGWWTHINNLQVCGSDISPSN